VKLWVNEHGFGWVGVQTILGWVGFVTWYDWATVSRWRSGLMLQSYFNDSDSS